MRKPKAPEVVPVALATAKKRATKTAKESPKKKTVAKPRAKKKEAKPLSPTNVLGKSIAIVSTDELERKIQIVENISSRGQTKRTITERQRQKMPTLAEFKTQIHLGLMTPFKLQLDQSQLASNMARVAGIAFTVMGAFLTLYNMNAFATFVSIPVTEQRAQAVTSCVPGTVCTDGTANTSPDVDFTVESSGAALVGSVPIVVTVSNASRVDIVAIHRETSEARSVGTATRASDLVWRITWDTTSFEDGAYRLRSVITNQYGSYTAEDSADYQVENYPMTTTSDAPQSTSGSDTGSGATSTEETFSQPSAISSDVDVSVEFSSGEPLRTGAVIETTVESASLVRHYIRRSNTSSYTILGSATFYGGESWRYTLDTARFDDGEYDIRTQVVFNDGTAHDEIRSRVSIDNSTEAAVGTTSVAIASDDSITDSLASPIRVELTQSSPLSQMVDVYIHTEGASFVELFVIPERTLASRFLGLAVRQSDGVWRYRFDTQSLPNGTYALYASVRQQYGDSQSERQTIRVVNENRVQDSDVALITTLQTTGDEAKKILTPTVVVQEPKETETDTEDEQEDTEEVPVTDREILARDLGEAYTDTIDTLLRNFDEELTRIMYAYGKALREDDTEEARALLIELEQIRARIIAEMPKGDGQDAVLARIEEYIEKVTGELQSRTEASEKLIKERLGVDVLKDSDNDAVTDYDEVNLYLTNPLSADTDNDGFIDGIEILNGYNPNDDARESNIAYESPKDQGIIRDDILAVDHVTSVFEVESERPKAHFAGTGLPNSFVTLYIFSTPIVVTVKTDSVGNWTYIFDKELEEGEHQVYVGMTDNAGKIVAKSNPLAFVKTAEAYAVVRDPVAPVAASVEPTLLGDRALLVIGSVCVVALGLVLLLLGLHIRPRAKESLSFAQPAT